MKIYNLFEGAFEDKKLIMSTTDKSKLIPDVLRIKKYNDANIEDSTTIELLIWEDGTEIDWLIDNDVLEIL